MIFRPMTEQRWPVRPNPLKDESLTSWVARLALGNGLPPKAFYVKALGWQDVWSTDFDLFDDQDKLLFLSEKTDKPLDALLQMKLADTIFPINHSGYLESHEFTHFCPTCLAEGTPYFRKLWRSSQIVTCERHGTFLHARCGGCHAPVRLLARTDILELDRCSACEHPLGDGLKPVRAPDDLLAYTSHLSGIFRGSWFPVGDRMVAPQLYLAGLPALAEIVCKREVWHKVYADQNLTAYFAKPFDLFFNYRESFVDRCVLQLVLSWIMADWPDRFFWATTDLPDNSLRWMTENQDLPFWLISVLKAAFDVPAADFRTGEEQHELIRLIGEGKLGEADYYRAFGRHHCLRINHRNLKSFKSISLEAKKYASQNS